MNLLDILANLPTIETERLLLRKITLNDASDMFEYASNAEVSEYTMGFENLFDSEGRVF